MNELEAALNFIRSVKKRYEDDKINNDRLRVSLSLNNGKEQTGTNLYEEDDVWILQSGSEKVLINPLAISSAKMIS